MTRQSSNRLNVDSVTRRKFLGTTALSSAACSSVTYQIRSSDREDRAVICSGIWFKPRLRSGPGHPETWNEVIQTTTGGSHRNEGMRFGMLMLAYLFSGFLYAGEGTPYIEMADAIFGKDRIREEANKLHAPLAALGYSEDGGEKKRFRRVCALGHVSQSIPLRRSPFCPNHPCRQSTPSLCSAQSESGQATRSHSSTNLVVPSGDYG